MKIIKNSTMSAKYPLFLVGAFVFFLILAYVVNISSQFSLSLSENEEHPTRQFFQNNVVDRIVENQWEKTGLESGPSFIVYYPVNVLTREEAENELRFLKEDQEVYSYTYFPEERVQDVMRKEVGLHNITGISRYGWEGFQADEGENENLKKVVFLQIDDQEGTIRLRYLNDEIGKEMSSRTGFHIAGTFTKTFSEYGIQFDIPQDWVIAEETPSSLTITTADPNLLVSESKTEREMFREIGGPVASIEFDFKTLVFPIEIVLDGLETVSVTNDEEYIDKVVLADEVDVTKRIYNKDGRIAKMGTTEVRYVGLSYPTFTTAFYTFPETNQLFTITVKAERYPSSDFFFTEQGRVARRILDSVRVIK